jgi:hypothetical protein
MCRADDHTRSPLSQLGRSISGPTEAVPAAVALRCGPESQRSITQKKAWCREGKFIFPYIDLASLLAFPSSISDLGRGLRQELVPSERRSPAKTVGDGGAESHTFSHCSFSSTTDRGWGRLHFLSDRARREKMQPQIVRSFNPVAQDAANKLHP